MTHRILSIQTVVAPSGAPQHVFGLRILEFDTSDRPDHDVPASVVTSRLYERLRAGAEITVAVPELKPFEREEPGLLLAERPLTLRVDADGCCHLTMP